MSKTVIGVFRSEDQAQQAVGALRQAGFTENEISLVAKKGQGGGGGRNQDTMTDGSDIGGGVTTGGVLGGLAGLAAGAGALVIPGIGPLIAAGPLAGLLSGAAAGGIAGGLIDWGIPEDRGRYYEEQVKQGQILAAIRVSDDKTEKAAEILRQNNAQDVETH
ncbi:MAG: general stress protein [bacterium]